MILMALLCVPVLAGLVAIWRWGDLDVEKPWGEDGMQAPPPPSEFFRRYLWYIAIAVSAGVTSGVVMMGIGGRLAMRLLAATSSDSVQGRVTEADEVVGRITLDGTLGLVVFIGILGGLVTGFIYIFTRRWLPPGRLGGLTYGAMLLFVAGSRVDPLRPDNPDFDIVGPGWLAVVIFIALGLGHGMLLHAIAARYSRSLPLISKGRTILRYAPLVLLAPAFFILVPVTVGAALGFAFSRTQGIYRLLKSERFLLVGRVALVVLAVITLPHLLSAVVDIVGRA